MTNYFIHAEGKCDAFCRYCKWGDDPDVVFAEFENALLSLQEFERLKQFPEAYAEYFDDYIEELIALRDNIARRL
jgi:hypothetical protein